MFATMGGPANDPRWRENGGPWGYRTNEAASRAGQPPQNFGAQRQQSAPNMSAYNPGPSAGFGGGGPVSSRQSYGGYQQPSTGFGGGGLVSPSQSAPVDRRPNMRTGGPWAATPEWFEGEDSGFGRRQTPQSSGYSQLFTFGGRIGENVRPHPGNLTVMVPGQAPQQSPGGGRGSPHGDFERGEGFGFQVITEWYNPETGERTAMPDSGYSPRPGSGWRQVRGPEFDGNDRMVQPERLAPAEQPPPPAFRPGQAPQQSPSRGTAPGYGNPDAMGRRTADWRDRDGDGVDDRDQRGPGQPRDDSLWGPGRQAAPPTSRPGQAQPVQPPSQGTPYQPGTSWTPQGTLGGAPTPSNTAFANAWNMSMGGDRNNVFRPAQSFGGGGLGNLAYMPDNARPAPFSSYSIGPDGRQNSPLGAINQRDAFISELIRDNARYAGQSEVYQGDGDPPPGWGAPPQVNVAALWGNANNAVRDGFVSPMARFWG